MNILDRLYNGDAVQAFSLHVTAKAPLDDRQVVRTRSELYTFPADIVYQGMTVTVIEDSATYMLKDAASPALPESWKKTAGSAASGTGGGIFTEEAEWEALLTAGTYDADVPYFVYMPRISTEKPLGQDILYDSTAHALAATSAYKVTGDGGTQEGTYTFTCTLWPDYKWADGTLAPLTVIYNIYKTVARPTGNTYVIDGVNHALTSTAEYTVTGPSDASAKGVYEYVCTPVSGFRWADTKTAEAVTVQVVVSEQAANLGTSVPYIFG